ncbi:MAG TPA: hypothetical protein VHP14_07200 [Anaerolineales bacterium]|nr:hypothetical protein [Anaerolineales bacterium]
MKSLRPLFFFVSLLLIVVLVSGCGGQQADDNGPKAIEEKPTATPPPEEKAAPQEKGGKAQAFFGEEFDNPLSEDWSVVQIYDENSLTDPEKVTVQADGGKLSWNLDTKDLAQYLFYKAYSYQDVKVEVRADNRGVNNNFVSLACRYDPEVGWYEFQVSSSGLYNVYFIEKIEGGKWRYNRIVNGGSLAIKQGKGVNEYAAVCKGDQLALYINGEKAAAAKEAKYSLSEGQVGIGVWSQNSLPVSVDMEWFKVSEP